MGKWGNLLVTIHMKDGKKEESESEGEDYSSRLICFVLEYYFLILSSCKNVVIK